MMSVRYGLDELIMIQHTDMNGAAKDFKCTTYNIIMFRSVGD